MNTSALIWTIVLGGAGTLLIRLLPMVWHEKGAKGGAGRAGLRRALDAVGPSAIVALLVASFWGMVVPDPSIQAVLPLLIGVLGVMLGKWLFRTIAWATLAGVLAYGCTLWALQG